MKTILLSLLCLLVSACHAQDNNQARSNKSRNSHPKTQGSPVHQFTEDLRAYLASKSDEDAQAQVLLAKSYLMGPAKLRDFDKAVQYLQQAIQQGEPSASYELGWCYYSGKGVSKDREEAFKQWKVSCEKGFAIACQKLPKASPQRKPSKPAASAS